MAFSAIVVAAGSGSRAGGDKQWRVVGGRPVVRWSVEALLKAGAEDLVGADVVIWTTTPWTMPGNRAVAYGEEIDYALLHVEGVAEGSLLKVGENLLVALPLLESFAKEAGLGAHSIRRVFKGAELAGTVLAHPLRGWAPADAPGAWRPCASSG